MDLTLLSSLRACWPFKTQIKSEFLRSPNNTFAILCVSDDQKCSKVQSSELCRTIKIMEKKNGRFLTA